jgi:hypothetical protein
MKTDYDRLEAKIRRLSIQKGKELGGKACSRWMISCYLVAALGRYWSTMGWMALAQIT